MKSPSEESYCRSCTKEQDYLYMIHRVADQLLGTNQSEYEMVLHENSNCNKEYKLIEPIEYTGKHFTDKLTKK